MVIQDIGNRISNRLTRYLVLTVIEGESRVEPIVHKASETTGQLLQQTYGVLILVWVTDSLLGYQLPPVVYGVALAAAGSLEMMALRFLDARSDLDPDTETITGEVRIVRATFGLGLFFLGFTIQFIGYLSTVLVDTVSWIPTVSSSVLNLILLLVFLPLAVSVVKFREIVAGVSLMLLSLASASVSYLINPSLTGFGLLLPVILFEIVFINSIVYKLFKGMKTFLVRSRGPKGEPKAAEKSVLGVVNLIVFTTGATQRTITRYKDLMSRYVPNFIYPDNSSSPEPPHFRQLKLSEFSHYSKRKPTSDERSIEAT